MEPDKARRWWLPGPPPQRRLVSIAEVEESLCRDGTPELSIPVRHVSVTGLTLFATGHPVAASPLDPYLGHLDSPSNNSTSTHLFHGCGNVTGPEVAESFSRRGPCIRFSRDRSYFSSSRAVYWSNSIEFAIAWSFFSETGHWDPAECDKPGIWPFQCLVYVSRLDLEKTNFENGLHLIPEPQGFRDEEEMENWCDSNMSKSPEKQLVSPPGAAKTEWGLIGSRIPKQTAKGLAKWHEQADKVWLFASCNETSSTTIARAGLEILCIAFTPGPEIRQRVSKL
nr:uncharacterized protein CTRU02_07203 [Colletotrichum truncatum]KAF6791441.1 hypothetical protein CTRU02_07203 [Colletotrichum truncatum]